MHRIMVVCIGNSCRSQIAEGYLRHFARGHFDVYSAGIETHGLNPCAVAVMQEDGIDISGHTSDLISRYQYIDFDYVITVCDHARTNCPQFDGKVKMIHHSFTDPAKAQGTEQEVMSSFRNVQKQIKTYCRDLVEQIMETDFPADRSPD